MGNTNNVGDAAVEVIEKPLPSGFAARFAFLRWVNLWELATGLFVLVVGVFSYRFDESIGAYAHQMVHATITYEVALLMPGMFAFAAAQAGDKGPLKNKVAQAIVSVLALTFGVFAYIVALRQFMGDDTVKTMLPQSLWVLIGRFYRGRGSLIDPDNLLRVGLTTMFNILWLFAVMIGIFGILKLCGTFDQPIPDWVYGIQWGVYYIALAFGLPPIERNLAADSSSAQKQ